MRGNTNEARVARAQTAEMFERMHAHEITLSELLRSPPAYIENMPIYTLLRRSPKMHDKGADRVCQKSKVWPLKKVGDLTEDDKQAIIAHLPPRAKFYD